MGDELQSERDILIAVAEASESEGVSGQSDIRNIGPAETSSTYRG